VILLNLASAAALPDNREGTLLYRHPEYERRWWWREFNRVSYLGGREYYRPTRLTVEFQEPYVVSRNETGQAEDTVGTRTIDNASLLFRHNREKSWEYENRRKRAHYHNFVKTTVNALVSHATKKAANREGPEELKAFWDGVDYRRQHKIDNWMTSGLRWAQVTGIVWACVDVDSDGEHDGKPYVYWVSPLDVFDWALDDDGELLWLKQFEYTDARRESWRDKVEPKYRVRIWHRDHVETWETDRNGQHEQRVGEKAHGAGRVPFEPLYSSRDEDMPFPEGVPLVGDLCKAANSVFNYTSLLNDILYKGTFSWLAIPDPNIDTIQVGTNTAFGYNPLTGGKPEYVSPDPEQPRVLMEAVAASLEQARAAVGIGRGRSEGSMEQASADALELESEDKRSILADIAREGEDFERRLAALVLGYKTGVAKVEGVHVQYPREFDMRTFKAEVDEVLSLRKVGLSPEIDLQLRQDLTRRKFAGLPPEQMEALLASLKVVEPPMPLDSDEERGQGVAKDPNRPDNDGQANQPP